MPLIQVKLIEEVFIPDQKYEIVPKLPGADGLDRRRRTCARHMSGCRRKSAAANYGDRLTSHDHGGR
jgi:hypothetical protein